MKMNKKYLELLSAYLDGELSPEEKVFIEDKIKSSLELRNRLTELKRLKELTSSAYDKLPEAAFFETRLQSEINSDSGKIKIKRWLPAAGLITVTAILMILLKVNPDLIKDIIEDQKANLASLYTDNLQPLLFAANLTNDDIFDFAFNSEIPLDETDEHFLKLGYDSSGAEYFEIKKSPARKKESSLEKFVQALEFDELQKKEIDSIIASYSDDLMGQILVSDKNTVAINPNLWNYQKAIAADILAYVKETNSNVYNTIIPLPGVINDNPRIVQSIKHLKTGADNKYIFITPDTIFTDTFIFDDSDYRSDMKEVERDLAETKRELSKLNYTIIVDTSFKKLKKNHAWTDEFSVHFDEEKFTVKLPEVVFKEFDIVLPNLDSINVVINEVMNNVRVLTKDSEGKSSFKKNFKVEVHNGDSSKVKLFDFDHLQIDSLFLNKLPDMDSLKQFYMEPFGILNDSTFKGFNFNFNDSIIINNNKELKQQMNELREELRKFREEMKQFRNQDKNNSDTTSPKLKGIEI